MSKRYLIIQTAFLGDTILTEPLIETIKENDKDSFICVLVIPQNRDVFILNRKVDNIITYDKHGKDNGFVGFIKIIKKIKQFNFDIVISPHTSFRSSLLALCSSAKIRIGFHEADISFVYTNRIHKDNKLHERDKNLQLLFPLGFDNMVNNIRLYYSEENKRFIEGMLEAYSVDRNKKIIGLSPSSVWPTKQWPKKYFKDVAGKLTESGYIVMLFGTQKDVQRAEFIKDGNKKIIDLTGKTNIRDMFYAVSRLNLLISNDSAPIHIASAYNIPTIDIYGPTVPEFGFYPLSDKNEIVEVKNLDCRPCGKHGSVSCHKKHFRCMLDITPEKVLNAAFKLL